MDIVAGLKEEKNKLERQLSGISGAIQALNGHGSVTGRLKKFRMPAAARKRIGAAARARWAAKRGKKRAMSAATRRKISIAAKARWAARVK
jgi:hypothetical protein